MQDLNSFEKLIGYKYNDQSLLKLALTHPSYANEHNINKYHTNQRLEFLGDAVLELVSSDFLYKYYEEADEGFLTKTRSSIVCEKSLSDIARELSLFEYLLLGNGESSSSIKDNDSVMCDTIEAIIGSIYKDSNLENAQEFIYKYILTEDRLYLANYNHDDYKSIIQEKANHDKAILKYDVIEEYGPDHDKTFVVKINYANKIFEIGTGKSKKEAEQNAAKLALSKL